MLGRPFPKDVQLLLEWGGARRSRSWSILERMGDRVRIAPSAPKEEGAPGSEALEERTGMSRDLPAAGTLVSVYYEHRGAFWMLPARSLGELREALLGPAGEQLELELCGEAERVERRFGLRVTVGDDPVRVSLEGVECSVLELCEVSFAVRAEREYQRGEVLEAVVYEAGEALPGRVRVESAVPIEPGVWRYGLICLDGRLKFDLASVALSIQRARIGSDRGA